MDYHLLGLILSFLFNGTKVLAGYPIWWSLALGQQYSSLGSQPILCGSIPGLVPKQLRFCRNYIEIMPSVAEGVKLGIQECQHQFRGRRWNCTTIDDSLAIFGPVLDKGKQQSQGLGRQAEPWRLISTWFSKHLLFIPTPLHLFLLNAHLSRSINQVLWKLAQKGWKSQHPGHYTVKSEMLGAPETLACSQTWSEMRLLEDFGVRFHISRDIQLGNQDLRLNSTPIKQKHTVGKTSIISHHTPSYPTPTHPNSSYSIPFLSIPSQHSPSPPHPSHPISSHLILFHPISSHPFQSHPITSHLFPFQPIHPTSVLIVTIRSNSFVLRQDNFEVTAVFTIK
uniref:Protein Wnt n=1 Tax=Chrysolophus pictus TaxID=9089 RepID=A0A8C3PUG1_CHRPC